MGTAERRLAIIKQLCRERITTLTSLAEQYGVSVWTIQRDIYELSGENGIPIYTKQGKSGGVFVLGNYTVNKMYMTEKETELLSKIKVMVSDKLNNNEKTIFDNIINCYNKNFNKSLN